MTLPAFFLGVVISTTYGALFHLWRGGGVGHLILYLIMGWIGFWVGQLVANWLGLTFASIGPLHLGLATVGSLMFLGIAYWLGKENK